MELILTKRQANAFVNGMETLQGKFSNYLDGELADHVKLDVVNGNAQLKFIGNVPEMIRIACYGVFVDALL